LSVSAHLHKYGAKTIEHIVTINFLNKKLARKIAIPINDLIVIIYGIDEYVGWPLVVVRPDPGKWLDRTDAGSARAAGTDQR
jgi:hypothetical protein